MSTKSPEQTETSLDDLLASNKELVARLDDMIHLQRFSLLEPDHVMRFVENDMQIAMSIPLALRDAIQSHILREATFYEVRMLRQLVQHGRIAPNKVIYDVGANIGNHTVFFGKSFRPKQMVAVEPQQTALAILKRNIALNDLPNTTCVNCLVGSETGAGSIAHFGERNLGATSFVEDEGGAVPMKTLDQLVAENSDGKVDFIKIDVEGMHLQVLAGASEILSTVRPEVWIELRNFKGEYSEGVEAFAKYDYVPSFRLGPSDHVFTPKEAL